MDRREFLKFSTVFALMGTRASQLMGNIDKLVTGQKHPNVIILLFDTLSAQHMSLYEYPRNTTPNIDRFAKKATVYHNHYTAGNFTTPATASILTGTYPWFHRALHLFGSILETQTNKNIFRLIPTDIYKIAYTHNLLAYSLLNQLSDSIDQLKKPRDLALFDPQYSDQIFPSDYNVSLLSESTILRGEESLNPTSPLLSLIHLIRITSQKRKITSEIGSLFPRGIPKVDDMFFILEDLVDWIMDEINKLPKPFLMYLHPLPPHGPYKTRRDFKDIFEDDYEPILKPEHFFSQGFGDEHLNNLRREYDEYLAYADNQFGRLYRFMEDNGILDTSYVIFTSDHGELFERGIHGHLSQTLFEPIIRVPLIISKPRQDKHEDVYNPTSSVDILPTLMHLYNQPIPEWCEGDVLPNFSAVPLQVDRDIYTVEAKSNPKYGSLKKASIALRKGEYKLVRYMGYPGYHNEFECFNIKQDPDELNNIFSLENKAVGELKEIMDLKLSDVNRANEEK
jgi:arylsulfatase A-like enzyme